MHERERRVTIDAACMEQSKQKECLTYNWRYWFRRLRDVPFWNLRGLPDGDGYHDIILPCGLFQEEARNQSIYC